MKKLKSVKLFVGILLLSLPGLAQTGSQTATRKVNITVNKPTTAISPDMWGIF